MSRAAHAPGEPIDLVDLEAGGAFTREMYVHGHVDLDTFVAGIIDVLTEEIAQDSEPGTADAQIEAEAKDRALDYAPIRHVYARWEFSGHDDYGKPQRSLNTYSKHTGRGSFPVTAGTCGSDRRAAERDRAQEAADVADLTARYPGIEITYRNGYGRFYEFRVPGMKERVTARWDDPSKAKSEQVPTLHLFCAAFEVPAWDAFRASVRAARGEPEESPTP